MTTGPVWSQDLVVALDYGQFHLYTATSTEDHSLELVDAAIAGEGIAQRDGLVVVLSPHQNNFAMGLRVEVWAAEPTGDLDDWQEAFEVHLDVGADGIAYVSPTLEGARIPVPAGSYHALVTGRGFVARGWPGSTKPGDAWRLRLWPGTGPDRPTRLRAYA